LSPVVAKAADAVAAAGAPGKRSRRQGKPGAAGLVDTRVVAADRDCDQIIFVESAADCRKHTAAASKIGIPFGDEARQLRRRQGSRGVGVPIVGQRTADREIIDRNIEQAAKRVDIVAAARKTPGRKGWLGRNSKDLKQIAIVGIAVAERDNALDTLRLRRRSETQRACSKQRRNEHMPICHENPPRNRVRTRGWSGQ
jgi:hypothetical protein